MNVARAWTRLGPNLLPFADAATDELPLGRLLRLSLFQVSVGMSAVLLIGTLNRVMIVELGVAAWLVAAMVALPLIFAPLRALIGFRSDNHRSALGWRRVPYIWMGTLVHFGGLAIMPFALLILSGDTNGPAWVGPVAAALAFLMVGAGLHTVQTVGLALAADLAPPAALPRVVALLSVMLLLGMVVAAVGFGAVLHDFSQLKLIQVIQGAAVLTIILNITALWRQEPRMPGRRGRADLPGFRESWRALRTQGPWTRRLVATGLGTAAFSMQDILLEPYGGEILGLSVSSTTLLTALVAASGIAGFVLAARLMGRGVDTTRVAAGGLLAGIAAFTAVTLAAPAASAAVFALGVALIGFGAGLFAHATLTGCMQVAPPGQIGLALGAWGAVQATAAGCAIGLGGAIRDMLMHPALDGSLGEALTGPAVPYGAVYLLEIALLFVTLAALGPLAQRAPGPVVIRNA
ncbi:BCD family MFS transporter [Roseomonas sp. CCTCC AB2023176]|uniref:BCD family MFS transporter n=1 Tax=Roseomonas sp. CCTCC AB2023176 TaxID=3342640 RepID=UPI0035D5D263